MDREPTEVELPGRDGRPVVRAGGAPRTPSLANPLNWLLLLAAVVSAVAILLYALAEVAVRSAREDDG